MKIKKAAAVFLAGALASSLMLGGCGSQINKDEIVATMGDQEISLGYAYFAARYNQVTYDNMFASYYGEGYWTNEDYADEDGRTLEESVKDAVMEEIETGLLLEQHMSEYGVEITEEEQAAMDEAAAKFMEDNSDEAVKALGATEAYVADLLYYETVSRKMTEAIGATADSNISDEECARRTFSYIQIDLGGYTDETGSYVSYTEEEADAIRESVPSIAEMAKSDFDAAAEAYSYNVSSYSYGKDEAAEADGGFSEEVIAAADSMTEGQVSDAIEADGCYYIIRLDSENDEEAAAEAREEILSDRQDEKFAEVTEAWKEESGFELDEDVWAKVHFTDVFTTVNNAGQESDGGTEEE